MIGNLPSMHVLWSPWKIRSSGDEGCLILIGHQIEWVWVIQPCVGSRNVADLDLWRPPESGGVFLFMSLTRFRLRHAPPVILCVLLCRAPPEMDSAPTTTPKIDASSICCCLCQRSTLFRIFLCACGKGAALPTFFSSSTLRGQYPHLPDSIV